MFLLAAEEAEDNPDGLRGSVDVENSRPQATEQQVFVEQEQQVFCIYVCKCTDRTRLNLPVATTL